MKSKKEIVKRLNYSKERFKRLSLEIKGLQENGRSFVTESYQINTIEAQINILEWILRN